MTNIKAILFDADGVMQKRPDGWRDSLPALLGCDGDPEVLIIDLYTAELSALNGQSDFIAILSDLLIRGNCRATLDDALRVWTMIETDSKMVEAVRTLRRNGVACYLASNQELYRARYMSEVLGYSDLFDKEFYSCWMGTQKPLATYFHAILEDIQLAPNDVLFIDDHQINVDGARRVGLHAATFDLRTDRTGFPGILRQFGVRLTSPP